MGDLNSCGGSNKRTSKRFIQGREWGYIGRREHTYERGQDRCGIDRVITRNPGRPGFLEAGWGCSRGHTTVAIRVPAIVKENKKKVTACAKIRQWLEEEEEKEGKEGNASGQEYLYVGEVYERLPSLLTSWEREVNICGGVEEQSMEGPTYNSQKMQRCKDPGPLRNQCSHVDAVSGGRRASLGHSREPFNPRDTCMEVKDKEGATHITDEDSSIKHDIYRRGTLPPGHLFDPWVRLSQAKDDRDHEIPLGSAEKVSPRPKRYLLETAKADNCFFKYIFITRMQPTCGLWRAGA